MIEWNRYQSDEHTRRSLSLLSLSLSHGTSIMRQLIRRRTCARVIERYRCEKNILIWRTDVDAIRLIMTDLRKHIRVKCRSPMIFMRETRWCTQSIGQSASFNCPH